MSIGCISPSQFRVGFPNRRRNRCAGLKQQIRPYGVPNQYQFLVLNPEGIRVRACQRKRSLKITLIWKLKTSRRASNTRRLKPTMRSSGAVKFIVDAQLPPALARLLRESGCDAFAVREIGLREANAEIWRYAVQQQAAIIGARKTGTS
jgi:hypothetical protein